MIQRTLLLAFLLSACTAWADEAQKAKSAKRAKIAEKTEASARKPNVIILFIDELLIFINNIQY